MVEQELERERDQIRVLLADPDQRVHFDHFVRASSALVRGRPEPGSDGAYLLHALLVLFGPGWDETLEAAAVPLFFVRRPTWHCSRCGSRR